MGKATHEARLAARKVARAKRRREKQLAKIAACDPICIECGRLAVLVSGERIYPHRPDLFFKNFFLCECGAYVGCHPRTDIPLGRPAGPLTRAARNRAHAAFDPLWRAKAEREGIPYGQARGLGYAWLAEQLGRETHETHIAWMDAAEADRVVVLCQRKSSQASPPAHTAELETTP